MAIQILIIDNSEFFRDVIRQLLLPARDINISGEATNALNGLALIEELRPDVVLMDIQLPDRSGIEAAKFMLDEIADLKIIMLSLQSNNRYLEKSLRAGVRGFLLKDCANEELVEAIQAVYAGKKYISH